MERTVEKIDELERKIRRFQANPNQNPESIEIQLALDDPGYDDELEDALQVGGKLKYRLDHLHLDGPNGWLSALQKDKDQILALLNAAKSVTQETDAKLLELKKRIQDKVTKPTINKRGEKNRKVLIFTAFADTASYLYDSLVEWAKNDLGVNIALVCGGEGDTKTTFGNARYNEILTNFSPRSKKRANPSQPDERDEIDILIATDCISEGQNLQDCDYLVNYDIHWNPVRIIQRFGRIDRIGSPNNSVHMVNFWPTDDLNKYIDLKNRVESRMALVDLSATDGDNLLADDEAPNPEQDLRTSYRDKQLVRLRNEVLDIEDTGDGLSLTDFTLDDFRRDLLKYLEANKDSLEAAPLGLYTCVPPHPDYKVISPGAIFCFSQTKPLATNNTNAGKAVNPLAPFFLVYVLEDGNIRFSFAHPKQILDIFRILCAGKSEAYAQLCDIFDAQTANGTDMRPYDMLLTKAVKSIEETFQNRMVYGLQSNRDFVLPSASDQANGESDLELVTWLVIK